jgi:phosphoethanolamine N-methyltransferase
MSEDVEYHDSMIKMLELIWGEGFMAPGGTDNIDRLVQGLDLEGKQVLDIGCGLGGPDCYLAREYGAFTSGIDLEPQLLENARKMADKLKLQSQCSFLQVEPGPLPFPDESFDLIISSGAFTQIPDKKNLFAECLRVLKPGGLVSAYDWTTPYDTTSEEMAYFFKMEGLTYALERPDAFAELFRAAGFTNVTAADDQGWYRRQSRAEYELIKGDLYSRMVEAMGTADADHFVKNWRAMVRVCEKGELTQNYFRAYKPQTAV